MMDTERAQSSPSFSQAWTPITTRLLLDGGASAWNVLDHAMPGGTDDFCSKLNKELEDSGLIRRLQPGRTNSEATTGISLSPRQRRGDRSNFIERSRREQADFERVHPSLHSLIHSIEETTRHHLQDSLDLDLSLTSVQLAEYPGDGVAGYIRHCDRGAMCEAAAGLKEQPNKLGRILTVIYYLTPDDWDCVDDGGCLRLFVGERNDEDHYDVVPYRNRMVIFRSDLVEHQVMASLRRPRRAVTIWLYGRLKDDQHAKKIEHFGSPCESVAEKIPLVALPGPPPLPIGLKDGADENLSIFVSIAAYRDSETGPTIRHLMETARHPVRVFVGLVLQVAPEAYDEKEVLGKLPNIEPWYDSHVRCLTLDARHATGPCSARALCQLLHRGEDYVLQVDSHMRFRANWDVYLIQQLEKCPGRKSLLTAYPVGYQLPNLVPMDTRGTLLVPHTFGSDGMLRQRGRVFNETPDRPVLCQLYAAGFSFGHASMFQDCPYDHSLHHLFFGEEVSMASRLYTSGYDMYAPVESICYHLWSRTHRPTDCFAFGDKHKEEWQKQSQNSVLRQLLGQGTGLGTERSIGDWANLLGVDFEKKTVRSTATRALCSDDEDVAPDDWEAQVSMLETSTKSLIFSFLQDPTL